MSQENAGSTKELVVVLERLDVHKVLRCLQIVQHAVPNSSIVKSTRSLKIKKSRKRPQNGHNCLYCKKSFGEQNILWAHLRTHTGEKPYSCYQCPASFGTPHNRKMHYGNMHALDEEKTYSCTICPKRFYLKTALSKHVKNHESIQLGEKFQCPQCNGLYRCLREHMRLVHTEQTWFRCTICDYKGRKQINLDSHVSNMHGEKKLKYFCTHCGIGFAFKPELRTHVVQLHPDDADLLPFKCRQCAKRFRFGLALEKHELTHTGEKPFKCDLCDHSCNQQVNLDSHKKAVHDNGEFKFLCPHCKKGYYLEYNLKRHLRNHSDERPFKCRFCDRTFKNQASVKPHELVHTGEKPFKCTHCGKSFRQRSALASLEYTRDYEL